MAKTIKELKEVKKYLKKQIKKINEKQDAIELANAISKYMDVEEVKKLASSGSWVHATWVNLHSIKAFNKLLKVLPKESYLCGYSYGGNDYYDCKYTHHIFLLDEKTAVEIQLVEKYKSQTQIPKKPEVSVMAYVSDTKLSIKAKDGVCEGTSRVSIMRSDYEPFEFNMDGDYSSLDGKDLVDVIGILDLANVIKKDKKDYHIQKVKTTKEVK